MRKIINYLLIGFAIMFLFTYISGLYDDAFKQTYHTGVWYNDILGSFKYYFLWVLPYWWFIIIIGSVVLALIFYGLRARIKNLKQK